MANFNLRNSINGLTDLENYKIEHEIDVAEDPGGAVNRVVEAIANNPDNITDPEVFDTTQSILKELPTFTDAALSTTLLESISSAFAQAVGSSTDDEKKEVLERYAFLLLWFVTAMYGVKTGGSTGEEIAAKGKGRGKKKAKSTENTANWTDQVPELFNLLSRALQKLPTERIWTTTADRDSFLSCITRPANLLAQSETLMKSPDIKLGYFKILSLAARNHGQAASVQTAIMQNLVYFEFNAEPMAELITLLAKEYDKPQVGEDILRELGNKVFSPQDQQGPKSFAKFLIKLGELNPKMVLKQVAILQKHLDSEFYQVRNAILDVLGLLIKSLSAMDDEQGPQNPEDENDATQSTKQIDSFFILIFERFLDLNGYVRTKVVQICNKLLDLQSKFPKQRIEMTSLAVRALEDKSALVRKGSIALLTKLILTHPYGRIHGGELSMEEWTKRYDEVDAELKPFQLPSQQEQSDDEEEQALEPDKVKEEEGEKMDHPAHQSDDDASEGSTTEDEGPDSLPSKKPKRPDPKKRRKSMMDIAAESQAQVLSGADEGRLIALRLKKRYYSDALSFIQHLENAAPIIEDLLASKTKSEVLESIEFFKVAADYKIDSSGDGIKRMLHLIWDKDSTTTDDDGKTLKGVRSKLIECYKVLFFDVVPDLNPHEQVNRIAKNMIELTFNATLADLTSLEQLLSTMMSEGNIHPDVVTKLWQVYSTTRPIPKAQRRGAIIVLGMCAVAKPAVVQEKMEELLKIGLGTYGRNDLVLAKYTCIALKRVGGTFKKVKGTQVDQSLRLPMDNPVFERLRDLIECETHDQEWFAMCEQALNTIYSLGEQPDHLCSTIIHDLTERVFNAPVTETDSSPQKEHSATPATPASPAKSAVTGDEDDEEHDDTIRPPSASKHQLVEGFQLGQLIFVAGHCAIKQIVHLEIVEREFKRRKTEQEKEDKATANKKSKENDELDQVVGTVEDDIADVIAHTKESELLYGPDALLTVFGGMCSQICSQQKSYKSEILRKTAVLSLSKFMCVSAKYCEEHLMMLFKILETSTDPTIRSNIVIALGDVAVSFSTIMDENSDHLYGSLTDKDMTVKKNTLMVLTHLILNGMIKVKGQLGEMAKCLEDQEPRISDLAKLFFSELSTKDNAIYNNLPDIISHLSVGAHSVDEETFKETMRFIFQYIEKEKQAAAIVEKLCQRFRHAQEERQWRDIAYCLSLLPFKAEASIKKLVEGLPFYQEKLHEEVVFKRFQEILGKIRLNKVLSKGEGDIAEFENAIEEARKKGLDDKGLEKRAAAKTQKAATRRSRRTRGAKASKEDSD
ncbi:hypothetical protein BT69DRAFT_1284724 [Atractiella rhizophila]|nr:hypothetical protein BT69DRAFT_1284724 [Atractiella rhizophila]